MFVYIYDGKISFFSINMINATFYLLYSSSVQHKIRMKSSNVWQCKLHIGCQWLEYFCLWNPSKRYACMPKSPPCLITEKKSAEQTLSFDFLNPSKFFLKEHGYSLPHSDVLAYTMCQWVGSGTGEQVPLLLLQLKTLPNKYNCGISSFIYYNCVLSLYLHKHNK